MVSSAVNFIIKISSKLFNNGIVHKTVAFKCICANISRQKTELFYKTSPEQLKLEGQWEFAILEPCYPSMYQNVMGKIYFFHEKLSKSLEFYYLEPFFLPFRYGYC